MIRLRGAMTAVLLAGCHPNTTRPPVQPYPEAAAIEIRLPPQEAIRRLAEALVADSVPLARVRLRDGYLESRWLDSASGRVTGRRPLGTDVVRIRGWVDPARPGGSLIRVETLYRPLADPSLSERELERQVPPAHPIAVRVSETLKELLERYGGPRPPQAAPARAAPPRASPRAAESS